jgi:hypothetical protein
MPSYQISLTVFFKDSFWVGIFEKIEQGKLSVSKVTFGAEPKDYQVYAFVLEHYLELNFSPVIENSSKIQAKRNPKRIQREAHKLLKQEGVGTKSQQALKLQQEQAKILRKTRSKAQKELENLRKFELKQTKKREKHKGH